MPWVWSVSLNQVGRRMWAIAPLAVLCFKAAVRSLKSAAWTFSKWWKAPLRCLDKTGPSWPIIVTFPKRQADSHTCVQARCAQVWKWGELQMSCGLFSIPKTVHAHSLTVPVTFMLAVAEVTWWIWVGVTLLWSSTKGWKYCYLCAACKYNMLCSEAFIFICSSLSVSHSFFPTFLYSWNVKLDFFDVIYEASPLLREYIW